MSDKNLIHSLQSVSLFNDENIIIINEQKIAINTNENIQALIFLSEENMDKSDNMDFLKKILSACNLSEEKYQLIFHHLEWKKIKTCFPNIKYIFLFGFDIQKLRVHLNLPKYYSGNFDGLHLFATEPLQKLIVDNQAKTYLWVELLQPVFAPNNK